MNLRITRLSCAMLLLVLALPSLGADVCPLCGGKLTKLGQVTDDRTKPSQNLDVWNRSMCANTFYNDDSAICTQCWHAYLKQLDRWGRSSELPDSFRRPLAPGIRLFPLPPAKDIKSRVVYSQTWTAAQITDSVGFWCTDSPDLILAFHDYARKHDLAVRTEEQGRITNQVYIAVEANPKAEPGVSPNETTLGH